MYRILVIEDNPASLSLMAYLLTAFGQTALTATNGEKGIEKARQEKPDLILCDVQLPKLNGYEVCRLVKSDKELRQIPIIAVTAFAMVGDRKNLLGAGFDGYISKPINPQTFLEQLKPFIDLTESGPPVKDDSLPNGENFIPEDSNHRAAILIVDNSPTNLALARGTLEPLGYHIILAQNVDKGLALARENKPDLILSDVHMPEKDGFDFIKAVKADPDINSIPFVFFSSTLLGEHERENALDMGADAFIIRPISPQELINEIEACLKRNEEK